jgi:hypothetical protein
MVLHALNFTMLMNPLLDRYESYLSHTDPVVLALNPFFVLE